MFKPSQMKLKNSMGTYKMYQLSNLSHYELKHCRAFHLNRRHSPRLLAVDPEIQTQYCYLVVINALRLIADLEFTSFSFHFMLLLNPVSC